jgi:hypothetical protein
VAAGGGLAFGLLPVVGTHHRQARELIKNALVAYLMHLRQNLQPASLVQRIAERVRRFVIGV